MVFTALWKNPMLPVLYNRYARRRNKQGVSITAHDLLFPIKILNVKSVWVLSLELSLGLARVCSTWNEHDEFCVRFDLNLLLWGNVQQLRCTGTKPQMDHLTFRIYTFKSCNRPTRLTCEVSCLIMLPHLWRLRRSQVTHFFCLLSSSHPQPQCSTQSSLSCCYVLVSRLPVHPRGLMSIKSWHSAGEHLRLIGNWMKDGIGWFAKAFNTPSGAQFTPLKCHRYFKWGFQFMVHGPCAFVQVWYLAWTSPCLSIVLQYFALGCSS